MHVLALALYILNSPLSSLYDIPVFPENDILWDFLVCFIVCQVQNHKFVCFENE